MRVRSGVVVAWSLVAVLGCSRGSADVDAARSTVPGERLVVTLAGRTLHLDVARPERAPVADGAVLVTVGADGRTQSQELRFDPDCTWSGPVLENGRPIPGAFAVEHRCGPSRGVSVSVGGTLHDLRELPDGRVEHWTATREPVRVGTVTLSRAPLPASASITRAVAPVRWMETTLVLDHALHQALGNTSVEFALGAVTVADALLRDGGLQTPTAMVATRLVVFSSADAFTMPVTPQGEVEVSGTLTNFNAWLLQNALGSDVSVIFSGRDFEGSTVGLAAVGGACQGGFSGMLVQARPGTVTTVGTVTAHEAGHLLNMEHDGQGNACPFSGFIMSAVGGGGPQPTQFSTCSNSDYQQWLQSGAGACLANMPTGSVMPRCGDGIVGPGEQCDCGTWCNTDPCCNGATCQLNTGATCSAAEPCCDASTCDVKARGASCAPAGTCTAGGACNGTDASTCFNTWLPVGQSCNDGITATGGRCFQGACVSRADACTDLGMSSGFDLVACTSMTNVCDRLACAQRAAPSQCVFLQGPSGPVLPPDGVPCGSGLVCSAGVCVAASNFNDLCPEDAAKTSPGTCGCGLPDADGDQDGTADCVDACPLDPRGTSLPCPVYTWVPAQWSTCSEVCGPGTQTRSVTCMDQLGAEVASSFCTGPMPATSRPCEVAPCAAPAWTVGPWSTCSATCGQGTQSRAVTCVDTNTGMTLEDAACSAFPRPPAMGPCVGVMCASSGPMSASSSAGPPSSADSTTGASSAAVASSGAEASSHAGPSSAQVPSSSVEVTSSSSSRASSSAGESSSGAAVVSSSAASVGSSGTSEATSSATSSAVSAATSSMSRGASSAGGDASSGTSTGAASTAGDAGGDDDGSARCTCATTRDVNPAAGVMLLGFVALAARRRRAAARGPQAG